MSEAAKETQEPDVNEKAATMGHVSKEDWKGDPAKWRPAKEFVERGEKIMPILQKEVEKLRADLNMSLKLNEKRDEEIRTKEFDRATKDYNLKLKALDKKEIEAFDGADSEAYQEVKQEREALVAPIKEEAPKKDDNVVFIDWSAKNAWYNDDPVLKRNADMIGQEIDKATPGLPLDKLYAKVEAQIREEFPHKFVNPNREDAAAVEGGDSPAPSKKNGYEGLPSSAKAQFKRLEAQFKANGKEYSKAQFVEAWNE